MSIELKIRKYSDVLKRRNSLEKKIIETRKFLIFNRTKALDILKNDILTALNQNQNNCILHLVKYWWNINVTNIFKLIWTIITIQL